MTTDVLIGRNQTLLQITFNRPDKKNAINLAMYTAMADALKSAADDDSVRAVVLNGAGGLFTSGNDLGDFATLVSQPDKLASLDNPILNFMTSLEQCPKPVVAAVDGVAVGIGTTLLLHCDLVYCTPGASFSLPFVNLGLAPEYACSYLIPRMAGHVKAAQWLLLGEAFSATDAALAGLVNEVVDDVEAYALARAHTIARQPPAAVRTAKMLLRSATRAHVSETITREIEQFAAALSGPEFQEAVAAFFEKRSPDFSSMT